MDRFVVGTGRCGSTLLSRMLAMHPDALSIFEFFNGLDVARRFAPGPVPGDALAELVTAEQPFLNAVLARGYPVEEVVYPFGEGRFPRGPGFPYVLSGAVTRVAPDDPDALFDELVAVARAQPTQSLRRHYRALFDWLARKAGRRCWIEKSGSSIDYLEALGAFFPGARFLHLHRDGRETALSMREHHAYRLPIAVMYQTPVDGVPFSQLPPLDFTSAPDPRDAISRILASRPPVEHFGRYWTDQVVRGSRALRTLDAAQYRELPFEDLVTKPAEALREVCVFFDLDPDADGFLERAAAVVRGVPPTRFDRLPGDEQSALDDACRAGLALLGR